MSDTKPSEGMPTSTPETPEAAALRAKKAELAAFRAAREAKKAPERERTALAKLEQQLKDEQALARAQDEYGEDNVRDVMTSSGMVIVKRDHHIMFKRFIDANKFGTKELETQIARCLVYPDADTLDKYIEREPFRLQAVAGAISILAGSKEEELAGK